MKPSLDVVVTVPFVVSREVAAGAAGARDAAHLDRRDPAARDGRRIARARLGRGPSGARTGPLRPDEPIVQDETVVGGDTGEPRPHLPGARPPASLTFDGSRRPRRRVGSPPCRPPGPRRRPRPARRRPAADAATRTRTTGSAASTSRTPRSTTCSAAGTGRSCDRTPTAQRPRAARRSRPGRMPRRRPARRSGSAASPARSRLEPLDVELLLVALAPDLDPRFERLYGYLHDDVSRRRASVGLALELSGVGEGSGTGRARLGPLAPLVAGGLLVVEDGDRPFLTRALRVPDRVAAHLLGDDDARPGGRGAGHDRRRPRRGRDGRARGRPAGRRPPRLRARADRDRRGHARAPGRSGASGRHRSWSTSGGSARAMIPREAAAAAIREARLRGTGLVAGPLDVVAERGPGAVRAWAEAACPVVLHGSRGWDPGWSRSVPFILDAGPPVRRRAAGRLAGLARRRRVGGPGRSRGRASVPPRPRGRRPRRRGRSPRRRGGRAATWTCGDVAAGARAQNAAGLERLARRIEPRVTWTDLVLPPRRRRSSSAS